MENPYLDPCARRTFAMLLVAATAMVNTAAAQTKTQDAPAKNTAVAKEEEEILVLSPFEVSVARDTGYVATETLAGTRIRTDLRDVASSISVVTRDFMDDIGATDNSTLLQYTTNTEVAGTRGSFAGTGNNVTLSANTSISGTNRIRGLTSADQTRDFFTTNAPWDSYNIDRIDIQRGPNAILFGLGSPAGIINATTRNAIFRDTGSVEARVASYGSFRSSLDVNKQLIDNVLAIRIDALWDKQKYQQKPAFRDDERVYGTVRWDPHLFGPKFATSIKAKFEHGNVTADMPRNTTPYDSITPWFDTSSTGANKITIGGTTNGVTNKTVYDLSSAPQGVSAWLQTISGQQTPTYLMSGTTGETYMIDSGYINNAFLNSAGVKQGAGVNAPGQNYSELLYGLGSYNNYQKTAWANVSERALFLNRMLTDPSVFDFYNNLIDGDNARETAKWTSYNLSLTQNGWGDRVGLELNYDYQKYNDGNRSLLGGAPTISIDVTQVGQDNTANQNFGRPYVTSNAGGTGASGVYEREAVRASLFAEFRAADFLKNDFLVKLLGRQRFNVVGSRDRYNYETRSWNMYANSNAWDAYTNQTTGLTNSFQNRPPLAVVYLGNTLKSATTAAGANIPGVTSPIALKSGNVYLFDSTWNAPASVLPSASWTPTGAYLTNAFNSSATTQASNPANYVGWSSNRFLNLMGFDAGDPLYTNASKTQRITTSYASSWQGFMWNEAFVPTIGWRYDEVATRSKTAQANSADKSYLNLDGTAYSLPDFVPANYYKGHSLSGGAVLHLNQVLSKTWNDALPVNVSLTYNDSKNFQVGGARVDMYNRPISNPSGNTKEYGVLFSTKDNRFSLRVIKYENSIENATISNNSAFLGTIVQGLRFRNVFLYQMTGYTLDTKVAQFVQTSTLSVGAPGTNTGVINGVPTSFNTRWFWTPAYVDASGRPVQTANVALYSGQTVGANDHLQTWSESIASRDASIRAWNDIQKYLDAKGFFSVWNFGTGPTTTSALTDRATYEASIIASGDTTANTPANSAYIPAFGSVGRYDSASAPAGYTIAGDQKSDGYEFEGTANVTKNWRLTLNASKATAIQSNIGGADFQEFVDYMDAKIAGPAGDMRQFNGDYQVQNAVRTNWNTWRATWTWQKLQEKTESAELRKWHFNIVTNYSFTEGRLKGVGIGGAYRWADKIVIGYPVYIDANSQAQYDITKPIYGPTEKGFDLWTSYERKLTEKIRWKIQFNLRNAFQKNGLVPITVEPDGTTWAGVRIKPVQEWTVTNSFTF